MSDLSQNAEPSICDVAPWQSLATETDATLQQLFAAAIAKHQPRARLALLAVGGYGRSELAPFSDLDVLLIHERKILDGAFAQSLWYPLWDAGRKVGHAVRTPKETFTMIRSDLDTATAYLKGLGIEVSSAEGDIVAG